MPFLIYPDDFNSSIKEDMLASVIESNPAYLNDAMGRAQSVIRGLTVMRYDIDGELNKTGADRDNLLIQFMVDLTLYNVHKRINPRMIPKIREEAKRDTMEILREIQAGKFQAAWKMQKDPTGAPESGLRFGTEPTPTRLDW